MIESAKVVPMPRLTDIRNTLERDRRGEFPSLILSTHARADIPYLLSLVERAVPYMEQAAGDDPHWNEQTYTATLWLRDVRGETT